MAARQQQHLKQSFLSRHVPSQISNTQKLCYRHRPDLMKNRGPDDFFGILKTQNQMEKLATSDREAISHIWSLFAAAPADQRTLILKGLVSTCCMPQLSFLHNVTKPLLRIDFVVILPKEISLAILAHLDAISLCHAAQVSSTWKKLADDDALWHRMCEQHIDKKCTKCGWGLPLLLENKRVSTRKRLITTTLSPLQLACGPSSSSLRTALDNQHNNSNNNNKRHKSHNSIVATTDVESVSTSSYPTTTTQRQLIKRRPWKDIYSERLIVEKNWRNNNPPQTITLQGHTDGVMCIQFCEIQKIIMTGSFDKSIRIWDLTTGHLIRSLDGHSRCIRALQFDDAKLVTGAMDNTLKIWNYHTGTCIRTLEGHTGGVLSLHFDTRVMASGSTDNTIRVWNFEVGECCTLVGHTEWVNSVRICHEGAMLVSSSDDATIRLWDLKMRTCTRVYTGHVGQVQVALPSPYGFTHRLNISTAAASVVYQQQQAATTLLPGSNNITDATTKLNNHLINTSSPNNVQSCSSSSSTSTKEEHLSDTPIIMSSSLDNTIKIWDLSTGKCLRTLFGHVQGIWGLAFDKLRIVSGSHDKTVRVWDTESGKCLYALEGHNGPVTAIALSDTRIVSAAEDGQVKIWDFGLPAAVDSN